MQKRNNRPAITLLLTLVVAFTFVIGMKFVNVSAEKADSTLMKKEYVSIEIEDGDTLWSLAKEHMGVGYSNINDYVKDIKSVNGISSDTIHSGNYILIPRYVTVEQ